MEEREAEDVARSDAPHLHFFLVGTRSSESQKRRNVQAGIVVSYVACICLCFYEMGYKDAQKDALKERDR